MWNSSMIPRKSAVQASIPGGGLPFDSFAAPVVMYAPGHILRSDHIGNPSVRLIRTSDSVASDIIIPESNADFKVTMSDITTAFGGAVVEAGIETLHDQGPNGYNLGYVGPALNEIFVKSSSLLPCGDHSCGFEVVWGATPALANIVLPSAFSVFMVLRLTEQPLTAGQYYLTTNGLGISQFGPTSITSAPEFLETTLPAVASNRLLLIQHTQNGSEATIKMNLGSLNTEFSSSVAGAQDLSLFQQSSETTVGRPNCLSFFGIWSGVNSTINDDIRAALNDLFEIY